MDAVPVRAVAGRTSGAPVEVRYSMGHMHVATAAVLAAVVPLGAAVFSFVDHPLPAALAGIVAVALLSLGGLAMARGDTGCVRAAGDGLYFMREGQEWTATWQELGRVTLRTTRWGLLQEFVVVGELVPGATKNIVWERFRPAGPGAGSGPGSDPRAAVTTIRFRNAGLARAEIGRLPEALLHRAGERYAYDDGLLAVIRGH